MRFPSLNSWAAWSRPWLLKIAAEGFNLDRACIVARAKLPMLTASYLRSLGVESAGQLDTERVLRLAGVEGLAERLAEQAQRARPQ